MPSPAEFLYTELAAFGSSGFRRNQIAKLPGELRNWREEYTNTGIFRSVLLANRPDFLDVYKEQDTLFYGDLAFDFDVNKDNDLESEWPKLVEEIERLLVPQLKLDLGIASEEIRFWFSGRRGIHVVVPASIMGVWPDHDLIRVYAWYATKLRDELGLKFLDLSLYASKHLYRLENSKHQKSGFYKFPLLASELRAIKSYENVQTLAQFQRVPSFFKPVAPRQKAQLHYEKMYHGALNITPPKPAVVKPHNLDYNQERWTCISTMFSDGFLLDKGSRMNVAFLLVSHFHQEGFTLEQAEQEMRKWSSDHCDPPMDEADWQDALQREYRSGLVHLPAGCSYIQRITPHLCQEDICIIGQAKKRKRS